MSIDLLYDVRKEARRLIISGSQFAIGDFRLKKFVAPLRSAAGATPIFGRVADSIEKLTECATNGRESAAANGTFDGGVNASNQESGTQEDASAINLLELINLLGAILSTQVDAGIQGELKESSGCNLEFKTEFSYRRIRPVLVALTLKGAGRLEVIRQSYNDKLFSDFRLLKPLIIGLEDSFGEIAQLCYDILSEMDEKIVPILLKDLDYKGNRVHGRRVDLISDFTGASNKELYLDIINNDASTEVKAAAIGALANVPECEDILLQFSKDRKKELREAAFKGLCAMESKEAAMKLVEALLKEDSWDIIAVPVEKSRYVGMAELLINAGKEVFKRFSNKESYEGEKNKQKLSEDIIAFCHIIRSLRSRNTKVVLNYLMETVDNLEMFFKDKFYKSDFVNTIAENISKEIIFMKINDGYEYLISNKDKYNNAILDFSFEAALRTKSPEFVFDEFSGYLSKGEDKNSRNIKEVINCFLRLDDRKGKYISYYYINDDRYHLSIDRPDAPRFNWDSRWIQKFIDCDELGYVSMLSSADLGKVVIPYLKTSLEKVESGRKYNSVSQYNYLLYTFIGLMEAGENNIADDIILVAQKNPKHNKIEASIISMLINLYGPLPQKEVDKLKEFAKKNEKLYILELFEEGEVK